MEDPLAIQCNLVGNPLHEEQLEIVRMVGDIYALNTVIDEERDLVYVTFGEIIASHLAAVDFVTDATAVPVPRRFKTVVTSAAGYPLDKTYYQTVKGMVTPLDILEPGGTLIIASECSEGFGSQEFRAAQERLVELGAGALPRDADRQVACRYRRVADRDAAEADAARPRPALHDRARQGRAARHRRRDRPRHRCGDCGERRARTAIAHIAFVPEGPYVVPVHAPLHSREPAPGARAKRDLSV